MININSIKRTLKSGPSKEVTMPLIQHQLHLISDHFKIPINTMELIADLLFKTGMQWDCPECDFQDCVSYNDIVYIGRPICPDCDLEME